MVIFSLKLLNSLRKAIAGRRFPQQLAGGVALGVLLGIIPHGNLLALFVLVGVLCFKVNHAMMGVIAILVALVATNLDEYSHQVGDFVLTHPDAQQIAMSAWAMPVVPWTNLNNTVVMGSFLIGLAAVLPVYFVTLPVFKWLAPVEEEPGDAKRVSSREDVSGGDNATAAASDQEAAARWAESATEEPVTIQFREVDSHGEAADGASRETSPSGSSSKHSVALFDAPHADPQPPRFRSSDGVSASDESDGDDLTNGTISIDSVLAAESEFRPHGSSDANTALTPADPIPTNEEMVSVETRIDVIRMTDYRHNAATADDATTVDGHQDSTDSETDQPMDEALRYLLSQLRHSQQRKAAG